MTTYSASSIELAEELKDLARANIERLRSEAADGRVDVVTVEETTVATATPGADPGEGKLRARRFARGKAGL